MRNIPRIAESPDVEPLDYLQTTDSNVRYRSKNYPRHNLKMVPCIPVVRIIYRPEVGYLYTLINPFPYQYYYTYEWFFDVFDQTLDMFPEYCLKNKSKKSPLTSGQ